MCSGGWCWQCHAVSSCWLHIFSHIRSCLKTQAKWKRSQLAPFPEILYLAPPKAVGFKMARSSGLKMSIRKELNVESDPRMRNRPLKRLLCASQGSCSQVLMGWAKLKQMGTEVPPSEATIKGAFLYGPRPRAKASQGKCLPAPNWAP